MRTTRDRIRHAISFEIIGLALFIPFGTLVFDMPMHNMGVIGIISSFTATGFNYLYNLAFDHAMQRLRGTTQKTLPMRIAHTMMFELGLLVILLPFIAWYLGVTIWHALVMDIAFALFYLVYAFVFNWGYDKVFPLPGWQNAEA